jgi:hypothetical protein
MFMLYPHINFQRLGFNSVPVNTMKPKSKRRAYMDILFLFAKIIKLKLQDRAVLSLVFNGMEYRQVKCIYESSSSFSAYCYRLPNH